MSATTATVTDERTAIVRSWALARLRRSDAGAARLWLCAAPVLALMLLWSASDGGYDAVSWLEGGLALVVVATWVRLVFGPARPLGRLGRAAVVAFTLYVAWSYASTLWAADKGTALIGSHRALLYLGVFALFASLEWTTRRLELALLAYLFGVGAITVGVLIELAIRPAPQLLQGGQLAAGLGYHNATAAFGTIGALGSIIFGCSRRRGLMTRTALAASATACLELSVLAQSRGWLYTLPLVVVIALAVTPGRGRALVWSLVPVGCAVASLPWALHGPTVSAGRVALLAALASGAGGLLVARFQDRFVLSSRGRRVTRMAARVMAAAGGAATAAAAIIAIGNGAVTRGWHQFTHDAPVATSGIERFGQLGSGRYDFWRVALKSFIGHPLGGLGQDNFAQTYVAARHTSEEPAWVHSLELRLLAHTGAVGLMLFVAFVAFAVAAYRLAARDADSRLRVVLAAALIPLIVFLVHGSFDWFWEIPALSVPALAFLGTAVALEPGREPRVAASEPGRAPRAATALGRAATHPFVPLAGAAAAVMLFGTAYIGEQAMASARALAVSHPARALSDTRLAAQLEPFSSAPQALAAGINLRSGNLVRALTAASAGLSRDSGDWVLWLEDGLAKGAAGRVAAERQALARAHELDPREPVIVLAQRRAGTNSPLTINQAASMLATRAQQRVAP